MIKTRNLFWLIVAVLLLLSLVACGGAKADSIRFDQAPRTVYVQGQELDLENAVLLVVKGDKTEQIKATDVTISGYDKDVLGKQTVTFTYETVSTTLDVTVIPRIEVEGAVKDYFVGDVFDQSKGRIRVANDLAQVSTVALSDAGVTVSGFDSSKAGADVPVTIAYGGYTGTVNVNVYAVAKVELSSFPSKTEYGSHETVFDVAGAYFTVSAADVNFERYVELNAAMIKGFDPSVATLDHIDQPLKQTVTISYLGYDFEMEISVKFSGVSLVQLRAKELASITDLDNIPADKGELALDAMRAYLALDNDAKEAVDENDKNTVARIAVIYGYARFLEEKDKFDETVHLSSVEQESGEIIGMFSIVASSYETTARDLALMKDANTPMIAIAELLQSIKGRFGSLEIKDDKTAKEYLDLLYTADGLSAAVEILSLMTELHKELEVVETDWKVDDLEAYKSNIKTAVVIITGSEFNPFKAPPYIEAFQYLSKWREKNDYFDIIYAYYMEFEPDGVINSLWQNVPMPEKLQNIYTMLVNAANKTANITVGGDLSEFYYYYKIALENEREILNGDNQLHIDIYNKLKIGNLIKSYMFVGNNMNNIGYIYYVSSMVGNERFSNILTKYIDIIWGENPASDFTDKELQAAVKELLDMYAELTPAEQYGFISALHCDYRYNSFGIYLLECYIDEDGEIKASSRFVYLLAKAYREMLSEEAFDVFVKLIKASEAHACRFRDAERTDEFVEMMEEILADVAKLSKEDTESFATLLDKMTLLYNECVDPTVPDVGAHEDKINQLLDLIEKFLEVSYAMNDANITATEKSSMAALWLAIAEKAQALEKEIINIQDSKLQYTYLYSVYSFDTDRDGTIGDEDMKCTLNYMLDEIRSAQINMLVTTTLTDPRNENTVYNGYNLYFDYDLRDFLIGAVDVMYASFKENANEIDKDEVFAALKAVRQMDRSTMFAFMMFNANAYFYGGAYDCLKENCSSDVEEIIWALLSTEEKYVTYMATNTEDDRAQFCDRAEALKAKYDALEDKTQLAEFLEMYNYYMKKYDSLKNS